MYLVYSDGLAVSINVSLLLKDLDVSEVATESIEELNIFILDSY